MEKLHLNELKMIWNCVRQHELDIEVEVEQHPEVADVLSNTLIERLQSLESKIGSIIESDSKRIEIVR